jgi:hypothetical protein
VYNIILCVDDEYMRNIVIVINIRAHGSNNSNRRISSIDTHFTFFLYHLSLKTTIPMRIIAFASLKFNDYELSSRSSSSSFRAYVSNSSPSTSPTHLCDLL